MTEQDMRMEEVIIANHSLKINWLILNHLTSHQNYNLNMVQEITNIH